LGRREAGWLARDGFGNPSPWTPDCQIRREQLKSHQHFCVILSGGLFQILLARRDVDSRRVEVAVAQQRRHLLQTHFGIDQVLTETMPQHVRREIVDVRGAAFVFARV
jgi:hypothetical protein